MPSFLSHILLDHSIPLDEGVYHMRGFIMIGSLSSIEGVYHHTGGVYQRRKFIII